MRTDLEDLKQQIASGRYEVDPHVIAGAILKRRSAGQTVSDVLVPAEVDGGPVVAEKPKPGPGRDAA
jgi:Anti-sigma-28 factor, FlgM